MTIGRPDGVSYSLGRSHVHLALEFLQTEVVVRCCASVERHDERREEWSVVGYLWWLAEADRA